MIDNSRDTFLFNSENINANRQGYFTAQQKNIILNKRLQQFAIRITIFSILLLLFLFYMVNDHQNKSLLALTWYEITLAIALFVVCVEGIFRWFAFVEDLDRKHVAYIGGKVNIASYTVGQSVRRRYKIIIKDVILDIPPNVAVALDTNQEYTVYYTPKSMLILSIEQL